ncbi:hyccin-like isoform X2 [Brevipalpus obovatus]|uniref:hyccin-like isoform X2 n=1 Tax=Brevipalpus obovatus TaxID=246614 RepID=UPI003D9E9DD4
MMDHCFVQQWINEFSVSSKLPTNVEELERYADQVINNCDLETDIFNALEDPRSHDKLLGSISNILFAYYRCKNEKLKSWSLAFLPSFIGIHLISMTKPLESRKKYCCVETILIGIYNLEVVDEEGQLKKTSFRLPNLTKPSIYHEPPSFSNQNLTLTEKALLRLEFGSTGLNIATSGPYDEYDRIYAGNRMRILSVLLKIYHRHMSDLPKQSYHNFCKMTLNCLYCCMYNGQLDLGLLALEEIHNRAVSSLYPNVLLMSSAMKGAFKLGSAKHRKDSHITANSNISKTATTNASFRTRKLPDDIPIVTKTNDTMPAIEEQINENRANGVKC